MRKRAGNGRTHERIPDHVEIPAVPIGTVVFRMRSRIRLTVRERSIHDRGWELQDRGGARGWAEERGRAVRGAAVVKASSSRASRGATSATPCDGLSTRPPKPTQ